MATNPFLKYNGRPDDYCEACGERVANHETDAGILCDECCVAVYGEQQKDQRRYNAQEKRRTSGRPQQSN